MSPLFPPLTPLNSRDGHSKLAGMSLPLDNIEQLEQSFDILLFAALERLQFACDSGKCLQTTKNSFEPTEPEPSSSHFLKSSRVRCCECESSRNTLVSSVPSCQLCFWLGLCSCRCTRPVVMFGEPGRRGERLVGDPDLRGEPALGEPCLAEPIGVAGALPDYCFAR